MANTGISESTFAFSFLHEFVNTQRNRVFGMPILPSTRQERWLGYDVRVQLRGQLFFAQFKAPDYLTGNNASYIKSGYYNSPYYRFELHKKSGFEQHRRLLWLSLRFPKVYYIAPQVPTQAALGTAYLQNMVLRRSRFIPLRQCGTVAPPPPHFISFRSSVLGFTIHSEVQPKDGDFNGDQLFEKPQLQSIDSVFVGKVLSLLSIGARAEGFREFYPLRKPVVSVARSEDDLQSQLAKISEIALAVFGLSTLLLVEGNETETGVSK